MTMNIRRKIKVTKRTENKAGNDTKPRMRKKIFNRKKQKGTI